ncbi:hypothetical protein M9458_057602, partial [Cirrhinus mrigala]
MCYVDGAEVDFVEVTAVLDDLQFQLLKPHHCACHLLNMVSTVDEAKACSNEAYKVSSRDYRRCVQNSADPPQHNKVERGLSEL